MATYSSILAWKIRWTAEPGRLQSMGLHRVRQDWGTTCLSHISHCRLVGDRRLLCGGYWLVVLVLYETHREGSNQKEGQMLKDSRENAVNRKHALKRWRSNKSWDRGRDRELVGNIDEVTLGKKGSWRVATVQSKVTDNIFLRMTIYTMEGRSELWMFNVNLCLLKCYKYLGTHNEWITIVLNVVAVLL